MVPALASKGLSDTQALAVLVWIGPAQVAGRALFAVLGRWLSVRRIGLIALAGAPLGCLLFAFGHGLPALLAFALLYGMANGVATLVRGALLPEYFGRAAIGRIGGLVSGIAQFARAAAPLASAWVLLALPGYRELLLCVAALAAVGWLCFAFARKP
jgi:MFS family permease